MCNSCHSTTDTRALRCALREAETAAARAAACARAAEESACRAENAAATAQNAAACADAALEKVRCLLAEMNRGCGSVSRPEAAFNNCGCNG